MPRVLMLLSNAFDPDPRVHSEAVSLVRHGYGVTILCWDRDRARPARETVGGIEVLRLYLRSTHGRGATQAFFLALFWILALWRGVRLQYDVVHAHDFDCLPLGWVLARVKRARLLYDSHEHYASMVSQSLPRWLLGIITFLEDRLVRRVDCLVTVGDILREDFGRRGARHAVVVGNWKRVEQFAVNPDIVRDKRREMGIADTSLVVGYVVRLDGSRKLVELIEAVARTPAVECIVGGDGPARPLVEQAARQNPRLKYLGFVPPAQVALYTCASDVITYFFDDANPNSRYSAPNKLFEALAAGKAVIAGNFGEIARIVGERECGIVLDDMSAASIASALSRLASDRALLAGFQANALEAGRNAYNWARAEETLLAEYRRLARERP